MIKLKYAPYELLGYKRKVKSQKVIGNIIYDIFTEREKNPRSSLELGPIIDIRKKYKIGFETLWKNIPDRIKRESLENNKKVVKLYESDIENIRIIVDMYERVALMREDEAKVIKLLSLYLFSIV